ncbi:MAG: hypothetical protein Q9164_007882 [Protoblastenia rupestris]
MDSQRCSMFPKRNLPWKSTYNVACPFPGNDSVCRSDSTNIRLDTGYIDSNLDLGINTPPEYRFLLRTVVECAPLKTEGYSKNVTLYSKRNNTIPKQRMRYYYEENQDSHLEWTYEYPAHAPAGVADQEFNFTDVQYDYTV